MSTPEALAAYYRRIAAKYPPAMARAILERAAEHEQTTTTTTQGVAA